MKTCKTCKQAKPETDYYKNRGGLCNQCKLCYCERVRTRNRDEVNALRRANYAKSKEHINSTRRNRLDKNPQIRKSINTANANRNRKNLKELRQLRNDIKVSIGCMNPDCEWTGEYHSCMLDFHHVDPSEKIVNISQVKRGVLAMLAEIEKCTILCSNCHRRATWGGLDASNFPTVIL